MKDKIDVYDLYKATDEASNALHRAASRLALHEARYHGIDTDRVRVGYVWLPNDNHGPTILVYVRAECGWKPITATWLVFPTDPHKWDCDDPTVLANIQVACKEAA